MEGQTGGVFCHCFLLASVRHTFGIGMEADGFKNRILDAIVIDVN